MKMTTKTTNDGDGGLPPVLSVLFYSLAAFEKLNAVHSHLIMQGMDGSS